MTILNPCPFCEGEAEVEREGTNRQSCIVVCTNCGCKLESNEIGYGYFWNLRVKHATQEKYDEALRMLEFAVKQIHEQDAEIKELKTQIEEFYEEIAGEDI